MYNLKITKMKTLDFEIFGSYLLTNEEMITVKGGGEGEGEPVLPPTIPPVKI